MAVLRNRAAPVLRVVLALLGLALVAYLVNDAGPERVAGVLWAAGPWLPLILALEVAQWCCDYVSLRSILGPHWEEIPLGAMVRSATMAYAMMVLLPAGRAVGEVTRSSVLSRYIGLPRAATASTLLQAAYLSANGVLSAASWAVVASSLGAGSPLALLLAGNVVVQAVISVGLIAILWDARLGRWLDRHRRRFLKLPEDAPMEARARRRVPVRAAIVCSVARAMQVAQYGVILHAVGGHATPRASFVAHGIHLIGSTLGDFLPNQLGVVDGAYRAFAADLGFEGEPARALSIAFLARIGQLLCAAAAVIAAAMLRGARASANEEVRS